PFGYAWVEGISRKLGEGGMGSVYLVRHCPTGEPSALDRWVAIKFRKPRASPERFELEYQLMAALRHDHIAAVSNPDFLRDNPFFVMEYYPGRSLSDRVREDGPLPLADALRYIRETATAVQFAHALNYGGEPVQVIHRDLKPGNLLLDEAGRVKVSDFGIAVWLNRPAAGGEGAEGEGGDAGHRYTHPTLELGTPGYMAPEQVSRRNDPFGPWTDVFGLGATLYHLLTGKPPFKGEDKSDARMWVLADPPIRPRKLRPDIPPGVEAVIWKCLQKDAANRYQTVAAFLEDLVLAEQNEQHAPLLTPLRRLGMWLGRHRAAVATAALAMCCVLLLGAAFWPNPDKGQEEQRLPLSPEAAARADVANGRRATLIDPSGPKVPVDWIFRPAEVVPPPNKDAAFAVQTRDLSACVLMRNPPAAEYRVRVGLRQDIVPKNVDPKREGRSKTGLVLGHATFDPVNGHFAHIVAMIDFTEPSSGEEELLQYADRLVVLSPLTPLRGSTSPGHGLRFGPVPGANKPLREIEADVRADGIAFRMGAQERFVPRADIDRRWDELAVGAQNFGAPIPPFRFNRWSPAESAVGLVFNKVCASVAYLTIESLPPKK
ncbi:MAG: serine/threonine protein kinase, partial [Gemmataceae bacterium]|nr:serine/threonine protein kinase [Gemmataceae bacterium]